MPVTITVDNIPIIFPFEPYDVQKDYMTKVIECLQNGSHGMLESPTGTGKTLSLLCSTLAWLTTKMGEKEAPKNVSMEELDESKPLSDSVDRVGIHEKDNKPQRPQIIYSSRTHTQLTQAIAELRRSHYAYVNTAVLGSRDQLCINADVIKETSLGVKLSKCRALVKKKQCVYHMNVERTKDDPVYHEEILDIEDLVKVGQKLTNCPYYMSRNLKSRADIVFMPYNYLLDTWTRKRMEIKLENCVVILDEGHNVEKMCEESASFDLSWSDISICAEELSEIINALPSIEKYASELPPFSIDELVSLRQKMRALQTSVDNIVFQKSDNSAKFNGEYIFELLGRSDINQQNFVVFDSLITRVTEWINNNDNVPLQHVGAGLSQFQSFLQIVYYTENYTFEEHKKRVAESYKVYVTLESKSRRKSDSRFSKKDDKPVKLDAKIVHFWCFNPAFGMQALVREKAHSVIITSGTLSPLQPLISELGIPMTQTLESGHVISKEQVYVGVIETGPDKVTLNSSYKTRNDPKYLQSLGRTILSVSRLIPHGLLVFFPSYAVMETCQNAWISTGVWDSLNKSKEICVEPRDKRELKQVMNRYYTKNAEPGSKGAMFMAVCRGKVSEGLDFIDHNGRGVIITGLPFPPCFDPRVEMKKAYLDENKKQVRGFEWYQLEATRAVNQAIGRVIRHKNDYGVVLFCDVRFSGLGIRKSLSCWIRNQVKIHNNFPNLPRPLAVFFKYAQETLPQPEIKPPIVENSDDSDEDPDVVMTNTRYPESPSKYSSYGQQRYFSRDYGRYPRKNLHQYQENYYNSKVSWWERRNSYGRPQPPPPTQKRSRVESTSMVSHSVPVFYENEQTQLVTKSFPPIGQTLPTELLPGEYMQTQIVTKSDLSIGQVIPTEPLSHENMPTQPSDFTMSYENLPTQPVTSFKDCLTDNAQGTVASRALTDYSSSMNCCAGNSNRNVTMKKTTGIVSRPGNARGGKVYVPTKNEVPSCNSANRRSAGRNVPSRTPPNPTPYARNTRGGGTYAAPTRGSSSGSINNLETYGRGSTSSMTTLAVPSSVVAGTPNTGVLYVDEQGRPLNQVASRNLYLIDLGNGQMLVQGTDNVSTVIAGPSANNNENVHDQVATYVPFQADPGAGEVQYYLVNQGGSGGQSHLLNNQYVLLDESVQYVLADPQIPPDVIELDD